MHRCPAGRRPLLWRGSLLAVALAAGALVSICWAGGPRKRPPTRQPGVIQVRVGPLRQAIVDLIETFGPEYPKGREYLQSLDALQAMRMAPEAMQQRLRTIQREALLANPLLRFGRLLVVKRKIGPKDPGFPSNHECNSSLKRTGWDNEIAILSPIAPTGKLTTLYRPRDRGYVGEVDLHWDATRMLLSQSDRTSWKVWEMGVDPSASSGQAGRVRQVSKMPDDVDAFDPCYLPDGRIIFGSTASYQSVPCWHGQKWVQNLYVMNAGGSGVRQLCFDQDHDYHPSVLPDGQVVYLRWDYTGICHIYLRQLMVMNPDGTGQRAIYGSNSWFPNSLFFPRALPGRPGRLVCILSGYHGPNRMGQLVVVDTSRGSYETDGLVTRISGRGDPIRPMIRDNLVEQDWPKFLTPFPLSDKHFLAACWQGGSSNWAIVLADVFDNVVVVREEPGHALLEPVPLMARPTPPVAMDRTDPSRKDGVVYLHNVYAGPGLEGVPRGTIKRLRIVAYNFGYRHLAGPDKIGYGGPWEAMRILGTVPLDPDGSVTFRVPANTPLAVQALDAEGKAVQLMRSWFTLMPGERMSCVGCHEAVADAVPTRIAAAARSAPIDIEPWHGPARGFDFEREVQPVLDAHCVRCHDGSQGAAPPPPRERAELEPFPLKRFKENHLIREHVRPDLRAEKHHRGYKGKKLSVLGSRRLHPALQAKTQGFIRYTPAYDALLPYVRRVSIEDDVSLLAAGEYHADTSELVQMLRKGHGGVKLDPEAWDRLITWIDLNAPCHGTWGDVLPFATNAKERRAELRKQFGGPSDDPETIPKTKRYQPGKAVGSGQKAVGSEDKIPKVAGWPFDGAEAKRRQAALGQAKRTLDLGGVRLELVRIPAGEIVMGSTEGYPDERPMAAVKIAKPFWMGEFEITNEQFRRFDSSHDPRYYQRLHARSDDPGLPLDGAKQPAVRVSWQRAMAFCRWLSKRTGLTVTLPTEAQWEWACRAGSATPLSFGGVRADAAEWANVADRAYANVRNVTGGVEHLIVHGQALCDGRINDGERVTAVVGKYRPNAWGLHDMHGNAAEWTRTGYRPYPYREDDGRNGAGGDAAAVPGSGLRVPGSGGTRRVVRGGSFFDRPARCRSAIRLSYPAWQRVFNVGFRVVCESDVKRTARR